MKPELLESKKNAIKIKFKEIDSILHAYMDSEEYSFMLKNLYQKNSDNQNQNMYGKNLFEEVLRFSEKAKIIAEFENFDVIHAHDWMTYEAGIKAKEISNIIIKFIAEVFY